MSSKVKNICSKSSCSHSRKRSQLPQSVISGKHSKLVTPKKTVQSKNVSCFHNGKSPSAGVITNSKHINIKPQNTTKSESSFNSKTQAKCLDYCDKCGDVITKLSQPNIEIKIDKNASNTSQILLQTCSNKNIAIRSQNREINEETVRQYYRNENFQQSTDSIPLITNDFKKISLDTIKELSEDSKVIFPQNNDEIGYLNTESYENIKKLKEFRQNNYFECHSAKNRVTNKGSVTSLRGHKCFYRFYLNERLYPIPLSMDHKSEIRCVECHLPMTNEIDCINGTIQAKVQIGSTNEDVTLMLPVRNSLIVKPRKKKGLSDDILYFGVIKLGQNGDSLFNTVATDNSFALRYQKGYKEYISDRYTYKSVDSDIVFV